MHGRCARRSKKVGFAARTCFVLRALGRWCRRPGTAREGLKHDTRLLGPFSSTPSPLNALPKLEIKTANTRVPPPPDSPRFSDNLSPYTNTVQHTVGYLKERERHIGRIMLCPLTALSPTKNNDFFLCSNWVVFIFDKKNSYDSAKVIGKNRILTKFEYYSS